MAKNNKKYYNRKTKKNDGGSTFNTIEERLNNTKFCLPAWYTRDNEGNYKEGKFSIDKSLISLDKDKDKMFSEHLKNIDGASKDDIYMLDLQPVNDNEVITLKNGKKINSLVYKQKKHNSSPVYRVCYNKELNYNDWEKLFPQKENDEIIHSHLEPVLPPEKNTNKNVISPPPSTDIDNLNDEIDDNEHEPVDGGRKRKQNKSKKRKISRKKTKRRKSIKARKTKRTKRRR